VALMVQRLRDRCAAGAPEVCIGTSATMVSDGADEERKATVAAEPPDINLGPAAPKCAPAIVGAMAVHHSEIRFL
jgi:hypothetical protein